MADKHTKEELIDLYIHEMLDQKETAAFEERLQYDENLAREVELSRHIANAIERKGERGAMEELSTIGSGAQLKELLSRTERKYQGKGRRMVLRRWIAAGAVAVVAAVVIIGLQPRHSTQELFSISYERPLYDPAISRGEAEIPYDLKVMLDDAGQLYESGDMPGAARIYDEAVEMLPQSGLPDEALFYYAVTLSETDRIEEAQNILQQLAADPDSEYVEDAQWQLALIHIGNGERKEAIGILEAIKHKGGHYEQQAGQLLDRLEQKRLF